MVCQKEKIGLNFKMIFPTTGFIQFTNIGYLPTDLSHWQEKHIGKGYKYGVYLNKDRNIAECHIASYKRCSEDKLKEIYENQGKPDYYTCNSYPNAPFIVFKAKN